MLRLLGIGISGTPLMEVFERISEFHDIPYFTFETVPYTEQSYFSAPADGALYCNSDQISEITLDTNDLSSGSGQCQQTRDPRGMEVNKQLSSLSPIVIPYRSVDDAELAAISEYDQWFCATMIPDERLIDLATHVIFFNISDKGAIDWFSKRRKCMSCGNVHHLEDKPSRLPNVCDRCGTEMVIKPEDEPKAIKRQFQEWRNLFWRFEMKAKAKDCFRVYAVEKFADINELILKVNRDYRGLIVKKKDWYLDAKDIDEISFGPDSTEISFS